MFVKGQRRNKVDTTFVSQISGEINMDTASRIQAEFAQHIKNGAKNITLRIDSPGGNVAAGLAIYKLVLASKVPVTGVAEGQCGSIAFTILQGCKSRGAQPDTRFLIHHLTMMEISAVIYYDQKMWDDFHEGNRALQEEIIELHLCRSKISREELLALMKREEVITAGQAMSYGMIDAVTIRR